MNEQTNDWVKQELAIGEVLNEDPGLIEYLEYEESLPFPVIHLVSLQGGERRWGVDQTEIYVFKQSDGKAKYFGITWYRYLGDAEGPPEFRLDPAKPVVETTVRWELIA